MGAELSSAHNEQLSRSLSGRTLRQGIDHEGILKFRAVPFRGSTQVSTAPALFLEHADYTLKGILESRQNTTKLLTEEDLLRLLESVLYTLAYLQSKNILYRDLGPENIYYNIEEGTFKLLPPELIEKSSYELMLDGTRFSLVSPEMLVALQEQRQWFDDQLYHKSNVFMLGMIMLEAATLQPSCLCYEDNTLDILDRVVRDRLDLIRRVYPEEFAQLLQRMLEYDATKRMNPQQLALYLNQYFNRQSGIKPVVGQQPKPYLSTHPNQSKLLNQAQSRVTQKQQSNVRFNNLIASNVIGPPVAVNNVPEQMLPVVRQAHCLTPPKIVAVGRQATPTKIVLNQPQINAVHGSAIKTQAASVIPEEVLKYASINHQSVVVDNPQKISQVNAIPKKEHTNEAYTETRQSVLNKYARAKELVTPSAMLTPPRDPYERHYNSRLSTTPSHFDRSIRTKTTLSPPPVLRQRDHHLAEAHASRQARQAAINFKLSRLRNDVPLHLQQKYDPFDSPIRTHRQVAEEFSPSLDNFNHQVKLGQLRIEENSTDQSITRIKQEIEKSRRLIQQFQMRNRTVTEQAYD